MEKYLFKLITFVVLTTFTVQSVLWAAPVQGVSTDIYSHNKPDNIQNSIPTDSFADLFIPEKYGRIQDNGSFSHKTESAVDMSNSGSGRHIILIKDAHCNYEAQHNISKILEILVRDYGIDLVAVEGAEGDLSYDSYNDLEDGRLKDKAVDHFVKRGYVTGAEYLNITKDLPFGIYGMEDGRLYIDNYISFRETWGNSKETEIFIKQLSKVCEQLKQSIYSEELLELDDKERLYEKGEFGLTQMTGYLKEVSTQYFIKYIELDNFNLILKSIKFEGEIDYTEVEKERDQLIKELERKLPKEDLESLVKKSLQFRLGKIPQIEYYEFLSGYISKGKWNNLELYIDLVRLEGQIDSSELFNEINVLLQKVKETLCENETQRQLGKLSDKINTLDKLFHLKLTKKDLDSYEKNKSEFNTQKLLSFIRIQAPLNHISIPDELKDTQFLKLIDESILPAGKFYEIALKRDEVLVSNTLSKMEEDNKDTAVMVAGGFHAEGIKRLLEKANVRYTVITPKITRDQLNNPYLSIMLEENIDTSSFQNINETTLGIVISASDQSRIAGMLGMEAVGPYIRSLFQDLQEGELTREAFKQEIDRIKEAKLSSKDKAMIKSVIDSISEEQVGRFVDEILRGEADDGAGKADRDADEDEQAGLGEDDDTPPGGGGTLMILFPLMSLYSGLAKIYNIVVPILIGIDIINGATNFLIGLRNTLLGKIAIAIVFTILSLFLAGAQAGGTPDEDDEDDGRRAGQQVDEKDEGGGEEEEGDTSVQTDREGGDSDPDKTDTGGRSPLTQDEKAAILQRLRDEDSLSGSEQEPVDGGSGGKQHIEIPLSDGTVASYPIQDNGLSDEQRVVLLDALGKRQLDPYKGQLIMSLLNSMNFFGDNADIAPGNTPLFYHDSSTGIFYVYQTTFDVLMQTNINFVLDQIIVEVERRIQDEQEVPEQEPVPVPDKEPLTDEIPDETQNFPNVPCSFGTVTGQEEVPSAIINEIVVKARLSNFTFGERRLLEAALLKGVYLFAARDKAGLRFDIYCDGERVFVEEAWFEEHIRGKESIGDYDFRIFVEGADNEEPLRGIPASHVVFGHPGFFQAGFNIEAKDELMMLWVDKELRRMAYRHGLDPINPADRHKAYILLLERWERDGIVPPKLLQVNFGVADLTQLSSRFLTGDITDINGALLASGIPPSSVYHHGAQRPSVTYLKLQHRKLAGGVLLYSYSKDDGAQGEVDFDSILPWFGLLTEVPWNVTRPLGAGRPTTRRGNTNRRPSMLFFRGGFNSFVGYQPVPRVRMPYQDSLPFGDFGLDLQGGVGDGFKIGGQLAMEMNFFQQLWEFFRYAIALEESSDPQEMSQRGLYYQTRRGLISAVRSSKEAQSRKIQVDLIGMPVLSFQAGINAGLDVDPVSLMLLGGIEGGLLYPTVPLEIDDGRLVARGTGDYFGSVPFDHLGEAMRDPGANINPFMGLNLLVTDSTEMFKMGFDVRVHFTPAILRSWHFVERNDISFDGRLRVEARLSPDMQLDLAMVFGDTQFDRYGNMVDTRDIPIGFSFGVHVIEKPRGGDISREPYPEGGNIGKDVKFVVSDTGDKLSIISEKEIGIIEVDLELQEGSLDSKKQALTTLLNTLNASELNEFKDFIDISKVKVFAGTDKTRAAGAFAHMDSKTGYMYIDSILFDELDTEEYGDELSSLIEEAGNLAIIHEVLHAFLDDPSKIDNETLNTNIDACPMRDKIREKAGNDPALLRHYYARYYLQNPKTDEQEKAEGIDVYLRSPNQQLTYVLRLIMVSNKLGIDIKQLHELLKRLDDSGQFSELRNKMLKLMKQDGEIQKDEVLLLAEKVEDVLGVIGEIDPLITKEENKIAVKNIAMALWINTMEERHNTKILPQCMEDLLEYLKINEDYKEEAGRMMMDLRNKDVKIADIFLDQLKKMALADGHDKISEEELEAKIGAVRIYLYKLVRIRKQMLPNKDLNEDIGDFTDGTNVPSIVDTYLNIGRGKKEIRNMVKPLLADILARWVLEDEDSAWKKGLEEKVSKNIQKIVGRKRLSKKVFIPEEKRDKDYIASQRQNMSGVLQKAIGDYVQKFSAQATAAPLMVHHLSLYVGDGEEITDWHRENLDSSTCDFVAACIEKKQILFIYDTDKQKSAFEELLQEKDFVLQDGVEVNDCLINISETEEEDYAAIRDKIKAEASTKLQRTIADSQITTVVNDINDNRFKNITDSDRVIIAGNSTNELVDLYLAWGITLIYSTQQEQQGLEANLTSFLKGYYADTELAGNVSEIVTNMIANGSRIILPVVTPFIADYYNALDNARNLILNSA